LGRSASPNKGRTYSVHALRQKFGGKIRAGLSLFYSPSPQVHSSFGFPHFSQVSFESHPQSLHILYLFSALIKDGFLF